MTTVGGKEEVLELRGSGTLSFYGIPLVLTGLFFLGFAVVLMPAKGDPRVIIGLPLGTICAVAGVALHVGRHGCTIDRARRLVLTWWGVFVPLKKSVQTLEGFTSVAVTDEMRSTGTYLSRHFVYLVTLRGEGKSLILDELTGHDGARATAVRIAEFLDMPLLDEIDV